MISNIARPAYYDLGGWHHSRIEGLLADVAERLTREARATILFPFPRSDAFRQAVLQQLDWNGYAGRFEMDSGSGLLKLVVQQQDNLWTVY
jgi:hypothetical protein